MDLCRCRGRLPTTMKGPPVRILLLVLFSLLLATGQIFFKKAALAVGEQSFLVGIMNLWTLAAVVLYAGSVLLWIAILRTTPLSVAYPFAAIGFIVVPLAGKFLFNEQLNPIYFVGAGFIFVGIVLTMSATSS